MGFATVRWGVQGACRHATPRWWEIATVRDGLAGFRKTPSVTPSVSEAVSRTMGESISQSVSQSVARPVRQLAKRSVNQPTNRTVRWPRPLPPRWAFQNISAGNVGGRRPRVGRGPCNGLWCQSGRKGGGRGSMRGEGRRPIGGGELAAAEEGN